MPVDAGDVVLETDDDSVPEEKADDVDDAVVQRVGDVETDGDTENVIVPVPDIESVGETDGDVLSVELKVIVSDGVMLPLAVKETDTVPLDDAAADAVRCEVVAEMDGTRVSDAPVDTVATEDVDAETLKETDADAQSEFAALTDTAGVDDKLDEIEYVGETDGVVEIDAVLHTLKVALPDIAADALKVAEEDVELDMVVLTKALADCDVDRVSESEPVMVTVPEPEDVVEAVPVTLTVLLTQALAVVVAETHAVPDTDAETDFEYEVVAVAQVLRDGEPVDEVERVMAEDGVIMGVELGECVPLQLERAEGDTFRLTLEAPELVPLSEPVSEAVVECVTEFVGVPETELVDEVETESVDVPLSDGDCDGEVLIVRDARAFVCVTESVTVIDVVGESVAVPERDGDKLPVLHADNVRESEPVGESVPDCEVEAELVALLDCVNETDCVKELVRHALTVALVVEHTLAEPVGLVNTEGDGTVEALFAGAVADTVTVTERVADTDGQMVIEFVGLRLIDEDVVGDTVALSLTELAEEGVSPTEVDTTADGDDDVVNATEAEIDVDVVTERVDDTEEDVVDVEEIEAEPETVEQPLDVTDVVTLPLAVTTDAEGVTEICADGDGDVVTENVTEPDVEKEPTAELVNEDVGERLIEIELVMHVVDDEDADCDGLSEPVTVSVGESDEVCVMVDDGDWDGVKLRVGESEPQAVPVGDTVCEGDACDETVEFATVDGDKDGELVPDCVPADVTDGRGEPVNETVAELLSEDVCETEPDPVDEDDMLKEAEPDALLEKAGDDESPILAVAVIVPERELTATLGETEGVEEIDGDPESVVEPLTLGETDLDTVPLRE